MTIPADGQPAWRTMDAVTRAVAAAYARQSWLNAGIMGELKKVFRPEFLNRIDEVIVFHKLTKDEIKEIVELLLRRIRESMAERELQLELSEEAKDMLVDKGWDPAMGARPLRRAIQRYVEDPLADFVLRSQVPEGST